jgi:hypothetical protein
MDKVVSGFSGICQKRWGRPVKEPGTQTASEKVANMVATFLPEGSGGFQVSATQTASEKVDATVTTFLPEYSSAAAKRWFLV